MEKSCSTCFHADFAEYWDEDLNDEVAYHFCELRHEEDFDMDCGICEDYNKKM